MRADVRTWLTVAAFVAVAALLGVRTVAKLPGPAQPDAWAMTDFRGTIYYPAVAFLAGRNPYEPSFARDYPVIRPLPPYGPLIFLLHLPLALLPLGAAEATYFLFTLALTLAVAALALRAATGRDESGLGNVGGGHASPAAVFGVGTLMLLSRPGHHNLLLGQSTLEIVFGAYLAFVLARERPLVAMLGVALTTMKPQFALPLAVALLAAGELRVVAGGLALAAVVSLAALATLGGPEGIASWVRAFGTSSNTAATASEMWYVRVDLGHVLREVLGRPADAWLDPLVLVLVLALTAIVVRRFAARPLADSTLAVTAACVGTLVSTYHTDYDTLLLTLPAVALARRGRMALLALLLVPAVNYGATAGVLQALNLQGRARGVVTLANGLALAAALVVCAVLARRAPASPTGVG